MSIKIRKLDSSTENFQKSLHAVLAFEASEDEAIERSVAQILNDVKARGDAAVLEYTKRFDRVEAKSVDALELPMSELEAALESLEPKRRAALEAFIRSIGPAEAVHHTDRPALRGPAAQPRLARISVVSRARFPTCRTGGTSDIS